MIVSKFNKEVSEECIHFAELDIHVNILMANILFGLSVSWVIFQVLIIFFSE